MSRAPLERQNTVPDGVEALDPSVISELVSGEKCVVIDVRTFTQFSESRVRSAVNVCIPSTLLKRNSFSFQRMREFLPQKGTQDLSLVDESRHVVVYDQKTECLKSCGPNALLWTITKIREHLNTLESSATLGYIKGGFTAVGTALIDDSELPKDHQPVNPLPPVVTQNNPVHPSHSPALFLNESLIDYRDYFPPWIQELFNAQSEGANPVSRKWAYLQSQEALRLHYAPCDNQLSAGEFLRNRYSNISPYQHTRVHLREMSEDYINASYIRSKSSELRYIATQAPIPSTFGHFWQMIWDEEVPMVIMLTTLISETGQRKGDKYWITGQYRDIEVVSIEEKKVMDGIILRSIVLKRYNQERTITQIHYEDWPDVACPGNTECFLALLNLKRQLLRRTNAQVIVHCSAGCGRTGTFCTIDTVAHHLACNPDQQDINDVVLETVEQFRSQRMAMVQVQQQFLFCYDTLIKWYYQHFIAAKVPPSPFI